MRNLLAKAAIIAIAAGELAYPVAEFLLHTFHIPHWHP